MLICRTLNLIIPAMVEICYNLCRVIINCYTPVKFCSLFFIDTEYVYSNIMQIRLSRVLKRCFVTQTIQSLCKLTAVRLKETLIKMNYILVISNENHFFSHNGFFYICFKIYNDLFWLLFCSVYGITDTFYLLIIQITWYE